MPSLVPPSDVLEVLDRRRLRRTRREHLWMAIALAAEAAAIVPFLTAVSLARWMNISVRLSKGHTTVFQLGIWGEWRSDTGPDDVVETRWIPHFPRDPANERLGDADLPHYYNAQAVFALLTLVAMVSGMAVASLTFRLHRYAYKRLAAAVFFLAAMCSVVVVQVLDNSVKEWYIHQRLQRNIEPFTKYGLCTYLAYSTTAVNVAAGIVLLVASRKQKGFRAAATEFEFEDRPIVIGR